MVKVGGRERMGDLPTDENQRTMFLCAKKKTVERLFDLFPKSKIVIQKRALERRAVFISHLEKLESFLKKK